MLYGKHDHKLGLEDRMLVLIQLKIARELLNREPTPSRTRSL